MREVYISDPLSSSSPSKSTYCMAGDMMIAPTCGSHVRVRVLGPRHLQCGLITHAQHVCLQKRCGTLRVRVPCVTHHSTTLGGN